MDVRGSAVQRGTEVEKLPIPCIQSYVGSEPLLVCGWWRSGGNHAEKPGKNYYSSHTHSYFPISTGQKMYCLSSRGDPSTVSITFSEWLLVCACLSYVKSEEKRNKGPFYGYTFHI